MSNQKLKKFGDWIDELFFILIGFYSSNTNTASREQVTWSLSPIFGNSRNGLLNVSILNLVFPIITWIRTTDPKNVMFSIVQSKTFAFFCSDAKLNRSGRIAILTLSPLFLAAVPCAASNWTPSILTNPLAGSTTSAFAVFNVPTKLATNCV